MADREGQLQVHHRYPTDITKSTLHDKGPTSTQVLSVVALLPIGGILLAISGATLTATVIGLAVATPLFVIFSPVLVPAAIVIGLAVTGFLAAGAFGLTALAALSWIVNYARGAMERAPDQMEHAKRRMADAAGQVGQRTKDVGQGIQNRAYEQQAAGGRT